MNQADYPYKILIDRSLFIASFKQNRIHLYGVPVVLKYDPVVHNPQDTPYIEFLFRKQPTEAEQTLIQLALSEIVYNGPAVSEQAQQ